MEISLSKIENLVFEDIAELVTESSAEGFRHVRRLWDDFKSGKNRFDKPGEMLFVAKAGKRVVGVCGLNCYKFENETVGRLRRMYVLKEFRRMGIARMLTEEIIKTARKNFNTIVLKTDNQEAESFYKSLRFSEISGNEFVTHLLKIK